MLGASQSGLSRSLKTVVLRRSQSPWSSQRPRDWWVMHFNSQLWYVPVRSCYMWSSECWFSPLPDLGIYISPEEEEFFSNNTSWFRGNMRKRIAGTVSVQEDWTGNQRMSGHKMMLPDRLWRPKFPVILIGLDVLTEGEKAFNRMTVEYLLDPKLLPFLHLVENVSSYSFWVTKNL